MSTRPASMEPVIFTPQTVYCGDCLTILKHFPNCVDELLTESFKLELLLLQG